MLERSGTGAKYLLLVQEGKSVNLFVSKIYYHATRPKRHNVLPNDDPEPLLISEAIAAFYENNRALRAAGLPPLQSKTFADITMVGTTPTFKIPVTEEQVHFSTKIQRKDLQDATTRITFPLRSELTSAKSDFLIGAITE
ncbi:hypothetical protein M378DRAFT_169147 [Amanita muscaria Koide BX008]|uniref:Uncharacterized protein n=1 Tax=Amanita muscaria (strain Koide BX008) TaxID=946122 RepID=A0A0C2WS03_AMAMK|nr:hypothetical protein M378DRAFT_169147 [Amanita muscaria Koide BX008]